MNTAPTQRIEWPPPLPRGHRKILLTSRPCRSRHAQESPRGTALPCSTPTIPEMVRKVIWNFSFRPGFTDRFVSRWSELDTRDNLILLRRTNFDSVADVRPNRQVDA